MKQTLQVIAAIILVISLMISGFYLKRTINYNLFYKASVQEEIQPLKERVELLEKQMSTLMKQHLEEQKNK